MIDDCETDETARTREAIEEAGCALKRLVAEQHTPSPGGLSERIVTFCGEADLADAVGWRGQQGRGHPRRGRKCRRRQH